MGNVLAVLTRAASRRRAKYATSTVDKGVSFEREFSDLMRQLFVAHYVFYTIIDRVV
ncbi:hypothetical protein CASFOL_022420 [Castilleja foliolosa]|uniref:Uncharacterized protein n=1 Tax=Castilleja foliolosa TaxID=1961234 RepID=A0ABD3CUI8_9LAMI